MMMVSGRRRGANRGVMMGVAVVRMIKGWWRTSEDN